MKIELFEYLLSPVATTPSYKLLILLKLEHDTVIPLILHLDALDRPVDYVGCRDHHGFCARLLIFVLAAVGHAHLLCLVLSRKNLDTHRQVKELTRVDVSGLEKPTLDG